jgi:hypothetical protein
MRRDLRFVSNLAIPMNESPPMGSGKEALLFLLRTSVCELLLESGVSVAWRGVAHELSPL